MTTRTPLILFLLIAFMLLNFIPTTACELLGFSFNEPVSAQHVFTAFRMHGHKHPHGWGVAFYTDETVSVFKEAASAAESDLAGFLANYPGLQSPLLIGHVRYASVGGRGIQNTHPFTRELHGTAYTLAHNGTLRGFREKLEQGRFQPIGSTDSEFILCYLLGRMDADSITAWTPDTFAWLQDELTTINETGSMNLLFSDGTYLFAYFDHNGYNSLYQLSRQAPYGNAFFPDIDAKIDLSGIYAPETMGVIVATKPLTTEKWIPFQPGQLIVFKDGVQIFSLKSASTKQFKKLFRKLK